MADSCQYLASEGMTSDTRMALPGRASRMADMTPNVYPETHSSTPVRRGFAGVYRKKRALKNASVSVVITDAPPSPHRDSRLRRRPV